MKVKTIGNTKIGHFTFKTQFDCNSTFMRVQEYYESPKFRNKVFTHEEFMQWYAEEYGKFSYYTDWAGFNVPVNKVKEFFKTFPNLWDRERELVLKAVEGNYEYIIGTQEGQKALGCMKHEIAHGLYTTDTKYREEMESLVDSVPPPIAKKFRETLKKNSYCDEVMDDELHAYMIDGINSSYDFKYTEKQQTNINQLSEVFSELFEDYSEKYEVVL